MSARSIALTAYATKRPSDMARPYTDPHFLDLKEGIRTIMQKAFELFLLCDCKVYLLVEHQQEAFVFNSEDFSWPPPDRELVWVQAPLFPVPLVSRLLLYPGHRHNTYATSDTNCRKSTART